MSRLVAAMSALIVVMCSVIAFAAPSPQLRQCVQNNNASHAQVWQMFIQARNRGNISPAEQQQFRAMEQRLNAIKQNLSRGGLTLPECQRISQEIARERATVQRMAATPAQNPQLRQCVQNNNASHAQVWQMFIQARNRGNISPAEQQQFRAMEQRLNAIKANLSRGGLTLPECQRISQEIARERATVQRMAATPTQNPQLRQCVQNNNASHAQVWQMFIQARNRGNISPAEQQQFRAMEQRLNAIKQNLSRGGLTLPECQRISQEIARERATVQRMAATRR